MAFIWSIAHSFSDFKLYLFDLCWRCAVDVSFWFVRIAVLVLTLLSCSLVFGRLNVFVNWIHLLALGIRDALNHC
ncbi:hypothetical protein A1OK_01420 [Enterovibrio norvegicus FF-454]|uniref:Uncharacterized protein n=1 Tax=Enterovibrio norvegicus FF-454 TaxID=1185651 RepID=A0A1E5C9N9_9GAMM|nr:hypothetical protein A1OK_01420 [Enterovibrio norvegicus FF-454]